MIIYTYSLFTILFIGIHIIDNNYSTTIQIIYFRKIRFY